MNNNLPVSEFTGSVFGYIGYTLLYFVVGGITLGLAIPWISASFNGWVVENTIIDGRRLRFDGTGTQLFGNYIKWLILTFITFGIYGFWLFNKMQQWKVKHTHFVD
ncbi:MAG: hypothetical protein HUJ84_00055 [Veillonella sp.]|nr:hypothetical protein [Veillonella sp.]